MASLATAEALVKKNDSEVSGTVTGAAGASTLNNALLGVITTEALVTAAAADYTHTLTNNLITAASRVFVSIQNGTNTTVPAYVHSVTPGAGSVVILVRNGHASVALNGTLKLSFLIL